MAKRLGDSTQRGVELIFQFNNRQINRPVLAGLPDDVQSDPGKRRVSVVSMLSPAFGDEIDAQIALNRRGAADLDESPAKIRPGLVVYESGMQHCNTAPSEVRNVPRLMRWYCQTCCRNCSVGWAPRAGRLVTPVGAIVNRGWERGEYFVPGFWFQVLKKNTWPLGRFGVSCRSHFA